MKSIITIIFLLNCFSVLGFEYQVKRFNGKILVNDKPYSEKTILKEGDKITAIGKKSFIQIGYEDKSSYLIKNGEMVLEKVEENESIISLLKGKFFHYKKPGLKRKFLLKTKNATMGVRGTKYMVEATEFYDYLCVCEGEVEAKKNDNNRKFHVGFNEDLFLYHDGQKPKYGKSASQMFDMTSKEFKAMGYPVMRSRN